MPDTPQPDQAITTLILRQLADANQPGQMPLAVLAGIADSYCPGGGHGQLEIMAGSDLISLDGEGPGQWVRITLAGRRLLSGDIQVDRRRRSRDGRIRRRVSGTPEPSENMWYALAAALIAVGGIFMTIAATVWASDTHRSLWANAPMITGYVLLALGAACLARALAIHFGIRSVTAHDTDDR